MGRNHLRVLTELEGVELAAICDQDAGLLEDAERKYSVPGYRSWDEMLDQARLDAAVIAVPTRFHCEAGLAAIEHRLHVLIEKPIAANLDDGRRLLSAARDPEKVLAVGPHETFKPGHRQPSRPPRPGRVRRVFP